MRNVTYGFLLFYAVFLLAGCGHVISKNLRAEADPSLSFRQVLQNPNDYKGKTVVWGGEIVEITNQRDRTTLVEVLERPLSGRGYPDDASPSEGRFLVLVDQYLDPYVYQKGRKITVAGEILGEETKVIGQMDYRYPLLSNKQIYTWPVYYYAPYPYYYPYSSPYYYPYYYPYDPWWGPWYPRWGFGFGYHDHYHHH